MTRREPAVAGRFYPADAGQCRADVARYLADVELPAGLPGCLVGGIVPHAGWMCSGQVAAGVFQALARAEAVETFVLFGAVHQVTGPTAVMYPSGCWETPIGEVEVDERLADRLQQEGRMVAADAWAHAMEHSIEVQLPFIKHLFPAAKVLPIGVPPAESAPQFGRAVAAAVADAGVRAAVVGTTDLTHYGRGYGFAPAGLGREGIAWAKDVNDGRMIDLMLRMDAEAVVPEAVEHHNACGAGAVAATIAAAAAMGARRASLLQHTTSYEVLGDRFTSDAVGYASVVFGCN